MAHVDSLDVRLSPRHGTQAVPAWAAKYRRGPMATFPAASSLVAEMPSVLKLRVWVNSLELDHDLAAGYRPSLSPELELELRTLQLASAKCRWDLARGVAL